MKIGGKVFSEGPEVDETNREGTEHTNPPRVLLTIRPTTRLVSTWDNVESRRVVLFDEILTGVYSTGVSWYTSQTVERGSNDI